MLTLEENKTGIVTTETQDQLSRSYLKKNQKLLEYIRGLMLVALDVKNFLLRSIK